MCLQRNAHLAALFFTCLSCHIDVFHLKMSEARSRPPQMPHSQLEMTLCPISLLLLLPISLRFISTWPHVAFFLAQYYYYSVSGCVPNALKSGIISEQFKRLNNKEWAGLASPVTLHWRDYLEKVAKIYVGAEFISVCSWVVIKGLCAKQKSFPEQQLFFFWSQQPDSPWILSS